MLFRSQLDATPAVRLIDELMTYDPFADGDKVRAVVDDAIAGGDVKPDDIKGSLQMMLDGMAEQDEAWEKHVAQASQPVGCEAASQWAREASHAHGKAKAAALAHMQYLQEQIEKDYKHVTGFATSQEHALPPAPSLGR